MSQVKERSAAQSKTLLHRVVFVIRKLASHKGVSRAAIAKELAGVFDARPSAVVLAKAIKKGVASGVLVQVKQSFWVAGDPKPEPPKDQVVQIEDLVIGQGAPCEPGSDICVKYRGCIKETGEQFDAANKFCFSLGSGDVIKGWEIGIQGMCVGGKRRISVPSKLAYGQKGSGSKSSKGYIPPGADLQFLITRIA